jgi:hypothetical protein
MQGSLAMATILADLQGAWGWDLVVGHCREGSTSQGRDTAERVRQFAASKGLPYVEAAAQQVGPAATEAGHRRRSQGPATQPVASALMDMARKHGAHAVVLGTTATDLASRLLEDLLRGGDFSAKLPWRNCRWTTRRAAPCMPARQPQDVDDEWISKQPHSLNSFLLVNPHQREALYMDVSSHLAARADFQWGQRQMGFPVLEGYRQPPLEVVQPLLGLSQSDAEQVLLRQQEGHSTQAPSHMSNSHNIANPARRELSKPLVLVYPCRTNHLAAQDMTASLQHPAPRYFPASRDGCSHHQQSTLSQPAAATLSSSPQFTHSGQLGMQAGKHPCQGVEQPLGQHDPQEKQDLRPVLAWLRQHCSPRADQAVARTLQALQADAQLYSMDTIGTCVMQVLGELRVTPSDRARSAPARHWSHSQPRPSDGEQQPDHFPDPGEAQQLFKGAAHGLPDLCREVHYQLCEQPLLRPGERILVAVSGGQVRVVEHQQMGG